MRRRKQVLACAKQHSHWLLPAVLYLSKLHDFTNCIPHLVVFLLPSSRSSASMVIA